MELPAELSKHPDGTPLKESHIRLLEAGETLSVLREVEGSPVKEAKAMALVTATPEQVHNTVSDPSAFPQFMPYVKKTEVTRRQGNEVEVNYVLDFPWPVGDRHYTLTEKSEITKSGSRTLYSLRWKHIAGTGNINSTYGSWHIARYDDTRTLVLYTVFTDPGGRVPNWARNAATSVATPKVMRAVARRAKDQPRTVPTPPAPQSASNP
jgi:ribosome-associated toxin RatA of RatAB toxin-antitoxin module